MALISLWLHLRLTISKLADGKNVGKLATTSIITAIFNFDLRKSSIGNNISVQYSAALSFSY